MAAPTHGRVLISGENGTGKELVARQIHAFSQRRTGPFIEVNCAAIPEELIESELFGHVKGAFTGAVADRRGKFEMASSGTLFLDEVADMSFKTQAKVLRALQEQIVEPVGGHSSIRVDVRVIAATNKDLADEIRAGRFREDLYFRLNVIPMFVPPLRDRGDDVIRLAEHFMAEFAEEYGRRAKRLAPDSAAVLRAYRWPGNVRELRNILERAAILCDGGLITAEHLALTPVPRARPSTAPVPPEEAPVEATPAHSHPPASGDLQSMERAMIEQALQDARFNKSKAAQALGLTRAQLYVRMRKYGLE